MKVQYKTVTIIFDETKAEPVPITYDGPEEIVSMILDELRDASGYHGNLFNPEFCFPADIAYALLMLGMSIDMGAIAKPTIPEKCLW